MITARFSAAAALLCTAGVAAVAAFFPNPPENVPVYTRLKDLHLKTALVAGGRSRVTIIRPASGVYDSLAERVQRAIAGVTGVTVPIAADDSPAGAVPIQGNLIALGNRSANRTIGRLYDLYYCILDLKYPGPGGYNVRTLHSPFGDGRNVILLGGSDAAGVEAAVEAFLPDLAAAGGGPGELSLGHLMRIRLGVGARIEGLKPWDQARKGMAYGWNKVSELMAMYYLTGEERYAREMLRYAFPDERRLQELRETDFIDYRDSPLAESYDYTTQYMDLFWDLIEESPVFSGQERLRVTNAIARQLNRRRQEDVYRLTPATAKILHEDMHSSYSALCLHVLGRYFQKDYPDPVWEHCLQAARLYYQSWHDDGQFAAGADNLMWYSTEVQPVLTYMLLSGWRDPVASGALARLLRAQEALMSGADDDVALDWPALGYLNKAAYLTGDGRWSYYRERTGVDAGVFRVGQSFWPEEELRPRPPADLVERWNISRMPDPHRIERGTGFLPGEAFYFGSFRSAVEGGGDFIFIDGYNGESRNPYHAFTISQLRMAGRTALDGYRNQVLVSADGIMEPRLAMDGALKHAEVVGDVAVVVGEVPQMSWANWRRTLAQRIGRYAVFADDITFRASSANMAVETLWETPGDTWRPEKKCLEIATGPNSPPFEVHVSDPVEYRREPMSREGWYGPSADDQLEFRRDPVSRLGWYGAAQAGDRQIRFALLARAGDRPLACRRVARNAAALALPQAGMAVVGTYDRIAGDLVILAEDHLFGRGLTSAGLGETLVSATRPLDLMWDFAAGRLEVVGSEPAELTIGAERLRLAAGRYRLERALPGPAAARLRQRLARMGRPQERPRASARRSGVRAPQLRRVFAASLGGPVADLQVAPSVIYAAVGRQVRRRLPDGTVLAPLEASAEIRVLHWWSEQKLLLAGSTDDRVAAFDESGRLRWTFVSEKDPAWYGPGDDGPFTWLTYWPKLTGIHGLYSGEFLNGGTQAFVGSTNTLEILNGRGELLKRLVVLRGMVHKFALFGGPGPRKTLLLARQPSDWDTLTVIDNVTLKPEIEGFHEMPRGYRVLWAWMQNRPVYLECTDLNGDGRLEVVAGIDGVWNRVSVWKTDETPLATVNLPPGEGPLYRNLPGVGTGDLDGDGKKEIVVATNGRVLVALDYNCVRRWSRRLPATPTVLVVAPDPRGASIFVGHDDGSILLFDGQGRIAGQAQVEGRPARAALLPGGRVAIGTDRGQLAVFSR